MNNKRLLKCSTLPVALFCTALMLAPIGRDNQINAATNIVQQNGTVRGTIVDNTGEPIIGASIKVLGTTNGTVTDLDGNFVLNNVLKDATIEVSYIGFLTQRINVSGKSQINVILEEDNKSLDEIVVVGYGVQRKSDVTGATLRVGEKELQSRPVNNVLQALQGKAAGVDITSSERPGTLGSVNIRGVRSLTASNSPLYVVDGIPLTTGGLDYLNTNDIESVDVLKDASATAIYGSRGANGVVIITTKQGKQGKVAINYNGSVTAETLQDDTKMMNAQEYIDYRRWAYYYSNPDKYPRADQPTKDNDYVIFNGASDPSAWANIEKGWASGTWDGSKVSTTDWIGMIRKTGITQQHTVSASAGSEKYKGYFSFGYLDNEGTQRGQGYTRYSVKVSLDLTPTKWLTLGGNANITYSTQEYGLSNTGVTIGKVRNDLYTLAREEFPYAVPYDSEGQRIEYPGGDSTIKTVVDEWKYSQDQRKTKRIFGSLYAQVDFGQIWRPLDGLRYRLNFGPDLQYVRRGVYIDGQSIVRAGSNFALLGHNDTESYTLDQLVYYNKDIQKHSLGVTLLQSMTKYSAESSSNSANDIPFASQKWNALTNSNVPALLAWSSGLTEKSLLSYMARLNYSFADKYLLTVSGRWDGASQLAEGNKWSFFPSAALGWRIDQEDFMKGVKFVSQLKLRLGVGVTGNAAVNPYVTKGSLNALYYPYATTLEAGASPSSVMANQNLGWERTTQYNIGIDFSLFNGRIGGVIDLYKSSTEDLLMLMTIPTITGYTTTYSNIGKTSGKGIDIALNTVNIDRAGFRWTSDLSAAYNSDKITGLANGDDINNSWFVGEAIGVIYGYQSAGLWKEEDAEEMAKFNANGNKFQVGMIKPVDQNHDYKIDANNDRVVIGNTRPKWTLGFNNTFSYKGWEFSVFMFGRLNYWYKTGGESLSGRFSQRELDYYNENNKNSEYQKPIYTTGTGDPYYEILGYKKAGFIKIRNISLGYNFPTQMIRHLGISTLKLYGQITNPGKLYSQIDFLDMDVSRSTWNRGFTVGLNVGF